MQDLRSDERPFAGTARYRIERRLGAGGMGDVYQVFDAERGARVALKTLRNLEASALLRFKEEFRAIADLHHPNLVTLYELAAEGDHWFFTMELLDGGPLVAYVRSGAAARVEPEDDPSAFAETVDGPVHTPGEGAAPIVLGGAHGPLTDPDQFRRLRACLRQLAAGLAALHGAGKLHRDLKPSNVLVADGRVRILDFGLVADVSRRSRARDLHIVGTPGYMAPEQAGSGVLSPASDWYSVGVMMFEALTGTLPFIGAPLEVLAAKQRRDAPDPRQGCPGAPADLVELCAALLARDPAARPSGDEIVERLGRRASTVTPPPVVAGDVPLIGRTAQLRALVEAWRDAESRPVATFVEGSSGMGKSSLVSAFLDHLRAAGDPIVLRGRCYERESVPYKAIDSVIDDLSRYLHALPEAQRAGLVPPDAGLLGRLFPVLRPLLPAAGAEAAFADPGELRRRGFELVAEILARVARTRRLVLFIDDLQWGDDDSAPLLASLIDPDGPAPLLFIGAHRSEDADAPLLRALRAGTGRGARRITLAPLAAEDATRLARELLGERAEHAAAIASESSGNPFFILELSRQVDAVGMQLDQVIQRRVAQVAAPARALLETVAVAGRPIDQALAVQAAGLSQASHAALAELRAGSLLRAAGGTELDTFHDRIRESVLGNLAASALAERHRALALALERSGDGDPEALAHHWAGAGDPVRAATSAREAARRAAATLAFDRAARFYQLTLELEPAAPDRVQLARALGDALANAGRSRAAADTYLEAAPGDGSLVDLQLVGRAAVHYLMSGHFDEGSAALRRALPPLGVPVPEGRRATIAALLARRAQLRLRGYRTGRGRQLDERQQTALELCRTAAVGLLLCDSLGATYFHTRHLLMALDCGDHAHIAQALATEGGFLLALGGARRHQRGARVLERAAELAEACQDPLAIGHVLLARAIGACYGGRFRQAQDQAERAIGTFREHCIGAAWEETNMALSRMLALYYLGEFATLRRHVDDTLSRARQRGDLLAELGMLSGLANAAWLADDDPDAAEAVALDAWARSGERAIHFAHYDLMARAQLALYRGEAEAAHATVEGRWPDVEQSGSLRLQRIRIEALHLRARCAIRGAGADGPRLAARLAKRLRREDPSWAAALADLVTGGALAAGDPSGAAAAFARAAERFDELEMKAYAAAARWRLGELRGDEAGRADLATATRSLRELGVAAPARMVAMLAPTSRC